MLMGGTLNLHGDRKHTWTKLAQTAAAGSTSIQVLDASGWRAGDEIVLASTDFDPRQAERRTISAIRGNTITLDRKLDYMHFGKITFDVDERGEVGLLTRNIKLQASADAEQAPFYGGHVMAMGASKMFVEGVEFNRMGQNLTLARYPIHWHLIGDAKGQYIKNAAIHDTYNRCVTVHGTNYLRVENNVTYNTVGHCFFLEDGIEHGNEFVHNLAIQTKCHTSKPCVPTNLAAAGETRTGTNGQQSKDVLLPSDNTVASFWITNPDNTYRDNVAAGSDSNGFWMSLPEHPNGKFEGTEISAKTWPRRTKFREFKGNVAHSNYDAFMFDRNIAVNNTFGVTGSSHTGLENPADPNSRALESVFEDLTAYKNRNGAIWGRGEMHVFRNVKLADNAIGFTHASGAFGRYAFTSQVVDSLFVGETENIGNPRADAEKAYGRSLPKVELPDFPIRGYEYYDYRHDVVNTTFRNYEDNATRKTGAISNLMFSSFGVSTNNAFERVKFVNAKPVYFPPMTNNRKWASDNGGSTSYKTAAYRDKDGSLGCRSQFLRHHPRRRQRQRRRRRGRLRDQAHLERGRVQGRRRAHEYRRPRRRSWRRWWESRRSWPWWTWRTCRSRRWRTGRGAAPGAPGAAPAAGAAAGAPLPVLARARLPVRARSRSWCPGWSRRCPCRSSSAACRAQPQWQGVHRHRRHQRTRRYRDQGDHRTAEREPLRDGAGRRLVGDPRAAGIHHRRLGYGAQQPGCAAPGHRHLVLQGPGFALGQACLPR